MAQIADVVHVSAVLHTAQQLLRIIMVHVSAVLHMASYSLESIERMLAVLWEAERRWVRSREEEAMVVDTRSIGEAEKQSIRDWLMRLKDTADELKDWLMLGGSRKKMKTPMARMLPCLAKSTASTDVEDIMSRLEALEEQYKSFGYATTGGLPLASCREEVCVGEERTSSIDDDVLGVPVGRDDDKQRIIDDITQAEAKGEGETIIVPVFGLAGVGKTALARLVFNDPRFQDYAKAWVDLSSRPLQKGGDSLNHTVEFIRNSPGARLLAAAPGGNKKQLLVLDDLWVQYVWRGNLQDLVVSWTQELKGLLCVGTNLVVIVTTSSRAVAEHMASMVKPYELHPLSDDLCWAIIKRASDFEARPATGNQEEEEEAAEIASKCGGLPSVAQALGRIFRSVNPQEWPDIWNNIITVGSRGEDSPSIHSVSVLSHLRTIYHRLGLGARIGFALCAFIFPKGKSRSKRDVTNHLVALLHSGSMITSRLLDTSFLLREESALTASVEADEDAVLLTMNDLVHDFATYVLLGDRMIVVDRTNIGSTLSHENKGSSAVCALITNLDATPQNLSNILPAGIRALRFEGCTQMELSDDAFSSAAKHLILLDLSGCSLRKLPSSIGQLELLRYLNAPGIQDRVLPLSITGLWRLRYLCLRGSSQLLHLPDAFGKLGKLGHLDLSGCSGLKALPESFGRLFYLEHLDLSDCSCLGGITEALRGCAKLEYLNLSHRCGYSVEDRFHLKGLDNVLRNLTKLRFLGLSMCLDPIFYNLPASQSCTYVDHITRLVNVEHLDLSKNIFLLELPKSIGKLGKLRTLDISDCLRLRSLPNSIGELKELRTLCLQGCPKLKPLPGNIQKQLAELPFLQRDELLSTSTTDLKESPSSQAGTSHQEQKSVIAGVDQAQDMTNTSVVAASQLLSDPSSSAEPEITEVAENQ